MTEESFALAAVVTKGSDAAPSIETTVAPFATLGSTDPPWQLLDLHHDHLGSTRRVSWDGGGLSTKHDFLPFGEEIAPSQGLATKKFTGHERNQGTGLDYMLARHYGFRLPRFLSPDPVSGNLGIPDSWNAYSYVRNSPVSLVDPTGMYAINPNPTDPDWKDPCGKLGPLCSYDKEGKKLKRRAKRFIRRNAKNRAERKRLIWILENADANPHTIHVSTSGDARIKITPQGVTPSVGEDSLNPGELIATGDPKTVRALAADRQTRGSSAKVQYGEFSAELDKSTGRIVDARFTIFEGSHRVQPINVSLPLGDDVLSTFIHESAHVMGPYVLAEIQIHLYVGGTFAQ